jgi:pantoate--beta-alanine ligase
LRSAVTAARKAGKSVGFVPTMGALHEGHISLVSAAKKETGFVVVSIFVNPIQFGPKEDFGKYPRVPRRDCALLKKAGADLVFMPAVGEMYPAGFATRVIPRPNLTNALCGLSRPGHFEGVATVVAKLFNMVKPDAAYFGRKDYQQSLVIRSMARDLDFDVKIRVMPTVREKDGLAMSSRNAYLGAAERKAAAALISALKAGERAIKSGARKRSRVRAAMRKVIAAEPTLKTD